MQLKQSKGQEQFRDFSIPSQPVAQNKGKISNCHTISVELMKYINFDLCLLDGIFFYFLKGKWLQFEFFLLQFFNSYSENVLYLKPAVMLVSYTIVILILLYLNKSSIVFSLQSSSTVRDIV